MLRKKNFLSKILFAKIYVPKIHSSKSAYKFSETYTFALYSHRIFYLCKVMINKFELQDQSRIFLFFIVYTSIWNSLGFNLSNKTSFSTRNIDWYRHMKTIQYLLYLHHALSIFKSKVLSLQHDISIPSSKSNIRNTPINLNSL